MSQPWAPSKWAKGSAQVHVLAISLVSIQRECVYISEEHSNRESGQRGDVAQIWNINSPEEMLVTDVLRDQALVEKAKLVGEAGMCWICAVIGTRSQRPLLRHRG